MPVRERFPTFEDILVSRPDDLGAEIVLDLQRSYRGQSQFFSPTNYPDDLARHYNRDRTTPEFTSAVREAIDWARRELLLVQHWQSCPPADSLMLSRRGLAFTHDHVERLRLERILPDFFLHDRIRQPSIDIFNTGRYQAAVFEAFRQVEMAIREAAGYSSEKHGRSMIMDAFNASMGGPLVDASAPEGEKGAMAMLMAGAVGIFKNPRSHRDVELDDPKEAAELLVVASHLLRIIDARASARKAASQLVQP